MNKKSATMNDLAVMVQGGFDEMNTKFKNVDERLVDLKDRMIAFENELRAIRAELIEIKKRFDYIERRDEEVFLLKQRVEDLDKRLTAALRKR